MRRNRRKGFNTLKLHMQVSSFPLGGTGNGEGNLISLILPRNPLPLPPHPEWRPSSASPQGKSTSNCPQLGLCVQMVGVGGTETWPQSSSLQQKCFHSSSHTVIGALFTESSLLGAQRDEYQYSEGPGRGLILFAPERTPKDFKQILEIATYLFTI